MGTDVKDAANDYVAQELRAELARQRLSGRELARRMGVEHTWLYKRLTGRVPLHVGELVAVAHLLNKPVEQFFSGLADSASAAGSRINFYQTRRSLAAAA